mmetsp:Transcript_66919/g.192399  ORF Transcript_66919/g.192399 Transcript_66919/m.192399 type:complete len:229 (+) Transcript_66919:648-1334(+)
MLPELRPGVQLQACKILFAREYKHQARANKGQVKLAEPVVPLRPHPTAAKKPVDTPHQHSVSVQPHELVKPRKVPHLKLPIRNSPRRLLRTLDGVRHIQLMQWHDMRVQASQMLSEISPPIRHCRLVGQHEQRIGTQPLQRPSKREHRPEVLETSRRILRHGHKGELGAGQRLRRLRRLRALRLGRAHAAVPLQPNLPSFCCACSFERAGRVRGGFVQTRVATREVQA